MRSSLRRSTIAAAALTLVAALVTACGSKPAEQPKAPASGSQSAQTQSAPAPKKPIKIGAVFGTSGGVAAYGQSQKTAVELAVAELNAAGGIGGATVEVIFEDSAGNKDQAINSVRKLIDKDEVVAIMGPTLSAEMFAAGPVANQANVPILGVSNTAAGITDIGNYVFRNSLPESGVLPTTVKRAVEKFKLKKVALIYDAKDDFSVSGAKTFEAELKKNSVEIVEKLTYQTKDTDFNAQLTKIVAAKPEALVVSGLYQEAALILQQARQLGLKVPVIGGNGFNSPQLVAIAKDAAEGVVVGSPWYTGAASEKAKKFVQAYNAKYSKNPDQFAAQAYDGFFLIVEAIKKAGAPNREKIRDALAGIKDFEGVTGKFAFDDKRNPVMTPYVLTIEKGQYVELK